jgi:hypothetical protein
MVQKMPTNAKNKAKGRKADFWNISLPKETKGYVPRLLAVAELIKNPHKYTQIHHKIVFILLVKGSIRIIFHKKIKFHKFVSRVIKMIKIIICI